MTTQPDPGEQLSIWEAERRRASPSSALEHISIRLPEGDLDALRRIAAEHEVALSSLIRRIIAVWVEESTLPKSGYPATAQAFEEVAERIADLVADRLEQVLRPSGS